LIATLLGKAELDPRARADLGWLILRAGRPEFALGLCTPQSAGHLNLLSCRHTALAALGFVGEARIVAVQILETVAADPQTIAAVERGSPHDGYAKFLTWRIAHYVPEQGHWFQRAQLQAEAGQYVEAIESLETAAARKDPLIVKLGSTTAFRKMADWPRYRRLSNAVFNLDRVSRAPPRAREL